MEDNIKDRFGINDDEPDFVGEDSLNPENENEDIYPLDNIKIDPGYFSIFELKRKYDRTKKKDDSNTYSNEDRRNQIILDSEFQREEVWGNKQKSELIESVLMGLPIPIMYLFQDKAGNLIVVDGRQRLTAFFEFLDEKFALNGLNILKDLNGKTFGDIDPVYQSKLEDYQLITQVIKPPTPDKIKFQIFDRVNRGGTPLNNQEMRNALYQGNSTKLLKKLSKDNSFKDATDNSLKKKRMKDKYLILRSIAFYLYFDKKLIDSKGNIIEYTGDMDEFLGKTMGYLNQINDTELKNIEDKFIMSMKNSLRILGNEGFRSISSDNEKKHPINMNIFEVTVYVMCKLDDNEDNDEIVRQKYFELLRDDEFNDNIANHRDSALKYKNRYEIVKTKFSEVISFDK